MLRHRDGLAGWSLEMRRRVVEVEVVLVEAAVREAKRIRWSYCSSSYVRRVQRSRPAEAELQKPRLLRLRRRVLEETPTR